MYYKKTTRINDKIEIEKYPDMRYGAPGMKREEKKNPTPLEMERQNLWRRCRYLRRILELNFKGGDLWLTLTCATDKRPDKEEAPKVIRSFRDKLAKEYKKRGWTFKYVISCEIGKRGAVHWHMVLNDARDEKVTAWDLIRKYWTRGRPFLEPLDENRDYQKLAEYIVKEAQKRMEKEQTIEKLSYIMSRNMIKPEEKKEKVRAVKWKKDPTVPKGYRIKPGTLVNGTNPFTGMPYQHYTLEPLPDYREGGRDGTRKKAG